MEEKITYRNQLKSEEWKEKRLEILKRDNYACKKCAAQLESKKLHIHHELYFPDIYAWEHPDEYLTTLCHDCHRDFHKRVSPDTLRVEVGSRKYDEIVNKYPQLRKVEHFSEKVKWDTIQKPVRVMKKREPVPEYNVSERLDNILTTIYNVLQAKASVTLSEYEFNELSRSDRFIKSSPDEFLNDFYEHVYGSRIYISGVSHWEFSAVYVPWVSFHDDFISSLYKKEYAINPRTNELFSNDVNENVYWFG